MRVILAVLDVADPVQKVNGMNLSEEQKLKRKIRVDFTQVL